MLGIPLGAEKMSKAWPCLQSVRWLLRETEGFKKKKSTAGQYEKLRNRHAQGFVKTQSENQSAVH